MQLLVKKGLVILSIWLIPTLVQAKVDFFKYFNFSEKGVLSIWKEKLHKGKVEYKIVTSGNESYVSALSKKAASGIYYEFAKKQFYNPTQLPYISWKWKVNKFPTKDEEDPEDDFAARVYVIFPAKVFIFSKCIEYIWDDTLEEGTISKSPLSSRIKFFVLRKGLKKDKWLHEERNIVKDYMEAFGEEEVDDKIGAVAFMSDTDDTEGEAAVLFDEVRFGYAKPMLKKASATK